MKAVAYLGLIGLLAGCGGATATPIVIYVTFSPAGTTPAVIGTPTSAPTPATTPAPTPAPTRSPALVTAAPTGHLDLQIVDYGFSVTNDGTASYAVILHNPNPATWTATNFQVQISLSNASGPVDTETEYVSFDHPRLDLAVAGYAFDVSGNPDKMDVRLGPIEWQTIDFTPGTFSFSNVVTKKDQFGGYTTKGTATSNFELQQENAEIIAVYRDAGGAIVGGDSDYIEFIDSGQSLAFEINTLDAIKDVASTEMFWAF